MTTNTSSANMCPCGHPAGQHTNLCGSCRHTLRGTLARIPALLVDLDLTLTRQRRFGELNPRSSGSHDALPYNPAAATMLRRLDTDLATLTRLYQLTHPHTSTPAPGTHAAALWLVPRVDDIAASGYADRLHRLLDTVEKADRIIDAPPDQTYAGPCGSCGTDLYAQAGQGAVTCPDCRTSYDLATRRAWLLDVVDDRLATATEIARALTSLALPVTAERIRQWKHRDQLVVRASDRLSRPLFRVGDVVDLLVEYAEKRGA